MQAKELETELDEALLQVEYQVSVDSCKDHDVSLNSTQHHPHPPLSIALCAVQT